MPTDIWWVYVIQSEIPRKGKKGPLPGLYYVGMTNNPVRRLKQHNGRLYGGAKSTRRGRPWQARALFGPYPDRATALKAESALKRKQHGIDRVNWTIAKSPLCCGLGPKHPWVEDSTIWVS